MFYPPIAVNNRDGTLRFHRPRNAGMFIPTMIAQATVRCIAAALIVMAGALSASAQIYPNKPIRIVVPLPPGSNGDLMPRILGQHLSTRLGQPVVIENRSGAAQNLGAEYVSRAEPDGYTLLATPQGPLVISPSFYPNLPFDPSQFVPITIMAKLPYILVVNPRCRSRRSRSSSPMPRPTRASSTMARPGSARARI
jgi:tripartite-type tricarboxylate transporter receptor subunit TctC